MSALGPIALHPTLLGLEVQAQARHLLITYRFVHDTRGAERGLTFLLLSSLLSKFTLCTRASTDSSFLYKSSMQFISSEIRCQSDTSTHAVHGIFMLRSDTVRLKW